MNAITGRGCAGSKPIIGYNPVPNNSISDWANEYRAAAKKHAEWLLTPEGIEHQRREIEAVERLAQEKRLEAEHKDAWFKEMLAPPKVGTVMSHILSQGFYSLNLIADLETNDVAVYALMESVGEYIGINSLRPRWILSSYGRRGMKLFLSKKSREQLRASHLAEFKDCLEFGFKRIVNTRPIRITSYAKSGKAVNGELL